MSLDIIFISYDEPNAETNWKLLSFKFPYAKRVCGINGIEKAHKHAAELSSTKCFYVVDGDSEILPNFDFSFKPEKHKQKYTHIWKCKNPVNDLAYGYGGIKILSKDFFVKPHDTLVDITSTISDGIILHDDVISITRFNSSPFHAWRGAFRECTKLSSKIIPRQDNKKTLFRLNIWTTVGIEKTFGEYVINGAKMGEKYGEKHKSDIEALAKINDFNWLKDEFNKHP